MSKRIKFSNFFNQSSLNNADYEQTNSPTKITKLHESDELEQKFPQFLMKYFTKEQIEEYKRELAKKIKFLDNFLAKRKADDIIFWAKPPHPKLISRIICVLEHDRIKNILKVQMEDNAIIKIAYGWIEEQLKLGRPVQIPSHFFKEPEQYIKAVAPTLYSLQTEKIQIDLIDIVYKFLII